MRINKMKFLTSSDIRVSSNTKYACLDLRVKKSPKLSEIFKIKNRFSGVGITSSIGSHFSSNYLPDNESQQSSRLYGPENPVLVAELDLFKGQNISEKTFDSLNGYHIVIVLTHSLEVDYPGRDKEKTAFEAVC